MGILHFRANGSTLSLPNNPQKLITPSLAIRDGGSTAYTPAVIDKTSFVYGPVYSTSTMVTKFYVKNAKTICFYKNNQKYYCCNDVIQRPLINICSSGAYAASNINTILSAKMTLNATYYLAKETKIQTSGGSVITFPAGTPVKYSDSYAGTRGIAFGNNALLGVINWSSPNSASFITYVSSSNPPPQLRTWSSQTIIFQDDFIIST